MGKNDFEINKDDIKGDLIEGGALHQQYGLEAVQKDSEVNHLKNEVEIVKSEKIVEISQDPAAFGFEKKPTADLLKAQVEILPEVLDVKSRLNKALYERDIAKVAVYALLTKRENINNYVRILLMEQRMGVDSFSTETTDTLDEATKRRKGVQ